MDLHLILLVLLMISVIQATSIENEFRALKPEQNIKGTIETTYTAHIVECSRR